MKFLSITTISILAASLVNASSTTTSTTTAASQTQNVATDAGRVLAAQPGNLPVAPSTTRSVSSASGRPKYVSVTDNPKVSLKFGDKTILVTPDFNNPTNMLNDMKTKLQQEIGAGVDLTFSTNFDGWDTRKYDVMHHIHKYTNKEGLVINANREGNNVSLAYHEYPTVDEDVLPDAFKKHFLEAERKKLTDEHDKLKPWLTLINPPPDDSPMLKELPQNYIAAVKLLLNIKKEAIIRRFNVVSLYKKVGTEGLDPVQVFGRAHHTIDREVLTLSIEDAIDIVTKAAEALSKKAKEDLAKYTQHHTILT